MQPIHTPKSASPMRHQIPGGHFHAEITSITPCLDPIWASVNKQRDSNQPDNTTSRPAREVSAITSRPAREVEVDFQPCPKNLSPKDRRPRPKRTRSALHLEIISPVPKSEPLSTKCRVAPTGRALSLSRVPHAKKATNLDVLDVTARGALVWQGDVKQGGADLLVAPPKLNVRLPCQGPSQRREDRRSVERRN